MQYELIFNLNVRKNLILSIIFVFVLLSLSCQKQTATSFEIVEETSQIREIPKDWQKIETDYFSFSIPLDMKNKNVRGIDSFVMQFEDKDITLEIEYGDYSADLDFIKQNYQSQTEQTEIDGEIVEIVSCDLDRNNPSSRMMTKNTKTEAIKKTEKNNYSGVSFPGRMKDFSQTAISFEVKYKNLEMQETAKTILYSVKFKQK